MLLLSLLRHWWHRGEAPPVMHTLVCGATGSGKSAAELVRLSALARRGDCAIAVMDPPGTLASQLLLHLDCLGLSERAIYDRLADTDFVPGYEWLVASTNPDPFQREAENDERIREFASILLRRRRDIQDPAKKPLIEEGVLAALRLYLAQEQPVPLPWLAEVFDLRSDARAHLLAHCSDPQIVRKFNEYAALSPTARRTETGPVERILRALCMSPAFRVRSGQPTFNLEQFLDDRGILILDGNSKGNLSRDAASVMMGAIILRVIRHCRTGARSRVVLALDEAVNAGLIGVHESQALAEARKWNLEVHVLIQDPFSFASQEIQSNVLQNCWRHEWFRQGSPQAARLAAEDIAIPLLDPLRVHHTEYHKRTVNAGYERIPTTSHSEWSDEHGRTSRGTSEQTVLWPQRTEVADPQPRYTALQDQILLMQKELMLLAPGYRFVRADTVTAAAEYVPMLRDRYDSTEQERPSGRRRARQQREDHLGTVLAGMKQRPMFRSPVHADGSLDLPDAPAGQSAATRLQENTSGQAA